MGLFTKPEVTILKEDSDAQAYLERLETLDKTATGELKKKVDQEIVNTRYGIMGEKQIMFELKNSGLDLVVLHDIKLVSPKDYTYPAQIDFIVITPYKNVFIECKNLYGNIEVNSRGDFIRTVSYGKYYKKEGIYSPITQNARHMQVYKEVREGNDKKGLIGLSFDKSFYDYNVSLVVLANPKTVLNDKYATKEVKSQIIRADQLVNTLKNIKSDIKSSHGDMIKMGERILAFNQENRTDYIARYANLLNNQETENDGSNMSVPQESDNEESHVEDKASDSNNERICPRCGRPLVVRVAKKGDRAGKRFWGCTGFPHCRYIENIDD